MQKLAESNSKALIVALQEVIRDFNTKITDQFGDNFKQLNEAVGAMLEWQARYREQIDEMISQQTRAAENMETATSRYESLVGKAEIFNAAAKGLGDLLMDWRATWTNHDLHGTTRQALRELLRRPSKD